MTSTFPDTFRGEVERIVMSEDQQLRQRLESIGRLAGGVAHDFNNVLTAMNGYLHLLTVNVEKESKPAKYCRALKDLSERAAYLTQQLHLYTRDIPTDSAPVALGMVAENMSKMLNRIVGERTVIAVETPGESPQVRGDAIKVSQLILNLAMSTYEALGAEGGSITLAITQERTGLELVAVIAATASGPDGRIVRDIPPVPAIAGEIANELGGEIDHGNEPDGRAVVKAILPVFRNDSAESPQQQQVRSGHSPPTILLVENDRSVLDSVGAGLVANGYRVKQAATLGKAREILAGDDPRTTVAVVDLLLTDGSGSRLLSDSPPASGPAVIIVTGHPEKIPELQTMTDQRIPVLRKPYTITDLIRVIESLPNRNE